MKQLSKQWGDELDEAIVAGNAAADEDDKQKQLAKVERTAKRLKQPASDLLPSESAELAIPAEPLSVAKTIQVPEEHEKSLEQIKSVYSQQG